MENRLWGTETVASTMTLHSFKNLGIGFTNKQVIAYITE
ncbi:hypothetical protein HNQ85_003175 [Anoxybacillus calidus]|uniref:Uncharacterized protein n=1 Tax=[Anoxybacillus] calidus TaxID=575178 RepID=A0A7V9Z2M4_9BACL|nr:hypothetical protein [Anoxybacillus calidus]